MGEWRRLGTKPWRVPTFEEVQEHGEMRVRARFQWNAYMSLCVGGGGKWWWKLYSLKCLFLKIKNKKLIVELLKTRVIQAASKTKDWLIQGQFLLPTSQSFISWHLAWGRMIRNERNVYEREWQE